MNLLMFLSNRCNMACDYCFLDLNKGPAVVLKLLDAKKAADDHLKRQGKNARFTLLGGEPFIHYPLLQSIVGYLAAARAPVTVVTNGTRACPKMMDELSSLGAQVVISLDGKSASHDAHRALVGARGSSLQESLKALESCDKAALRANMVVCEDTAAALLSNVEFLREAGFRRLSFHLNVLERWTEPGIKTLSRALEGVSRYLRALKPGQLELAHLEAFSHPAADHEDDDLILGADGNYYPCDGLFARPYPALGRWTTGSAGAGVDWDKREVFLAQARAFIHPLLERAAHYSCPREPYFHALVLGQDPAQAVRSFHRADNILGDALSFDRGGAYARSR